MYQASSSFSDSVESEMARLTAEMDRGAGGRTSRDGYNYNYSSDSQDQGNSSWGDRNPPRSPLAEALASQRLNRHFIPRPDALNPNKDVDVFGGSKQYTSRSSPHKPPESDEISRLRLQKRQQQEQYARELAEASDRKSVGGLKRDVYLGGDSLLDSIGSPRHRSQMRAGPADGVAQTAREDRRASQIKYAEQIRQDSMAKPLGSSRQYSSAPTQRSNALLEERDVQVRKYHEAEIDSKRDLQRRYRNELDKDIEQRGLTTGREQTKLSFQNNRASEVSMFDRSAAQDKRSQQAEYARQISEAKTAAPRPTEHHLRSGIVNRAENDDNKYTAFKRDGITTNSLAQRRGTSPLIHPEPRNYSQPMINTGYEERSYPPLAVNGGIRVTEDSSRGVYGRQDLSHGAQKLEEMYAPRSRISEVPFNRFQARGEEEVIGEYSSASQKVQDYHERQRAFGSLEADYAARDRQTAPVLAAKYGEPKSSRATAQEEEWRRKKSLQEAYSKEIMVSASSVPISQPRVSLLRNDVNRADMEGGYRIRGTSTGGGASSFRLG